MRTTGIFSLTAILLFLAAPLWADRGPIVWNEGVELSQDSQKAIILHNGAEEVLILGTELKANKETEILEFIPFPAEPRVSAAKGNPFGAVTKLIREKGLIFRFDNFEFSKGREGGGEPTTAPVEIRFSERIGLHDVTMIKINDIEQFSGWLEGFFKGKGISCDRERLSAVYENARDYLHRGYGYFVFDSVKVTETVKFLEPLVYRFDSGRIYYPLKTSNLIGGKGRVELLLILPGSISDDLWNVTRDMFVLGPGRDIRLSSSSKIYPGEISQIYGDEPFFAKKAKTYLQAFVYEGGYDFKDDFAYGANRLVPYAYRYFREHPIPDMAKFDPPLTKGELRDFQEAFCLQDSSKDRINVDRLALQCGNFIPNDEYEVYGALFRKAGLSGIPWGSVMLEANTTRIQYEGKNIDKGIDETIRKNFNDNNRVSFALESLFPEDGSLRISIRTDTGKKTLTFPKVGRTYVSRAGFNKERSGALVYVEHISGPRSGVGYFVSVGKSGGEWNITGSHLGRMY
jgi:hypothetical protein